MDEVMGTESCIAGCRISVHVAARVLVILLGLILAVNPALQEMMENFLEAPIIPAAKSESDAFAGSKTVGKMLKPDQAIRRDEKDLILRNPVPDKESVSDQLLSEVIVPDMALNLPHMSEETGRNLTEELADMEVVAADFPEIPSDGQALTTPIISDHVNPDEIVVEKVPEDSMKTEITMPEPDITVTEKTTNDAVKDDTVKTEVTVPKEDMVVSENTGDDPAASEVIIPEPPVSNDTIIDNPSEDLSIPEPVIPDTETKVSDVTDNVPSDIGEESGGAGENVSCFLLDEAGMLYGFLPEYAEIPDGCLTLPEECTGIRSGAFSGCSAEILELYIPAGAATIEEGALAGLNYLEWIEVESGNPGCTSDSGVLFDSTMSVLLAFPSAWMDGYLVPDTVTRIAGRAFEGTSISILDIRECSSLSFGDNAFGYSAGSGIQVVVSEEGLQVYAEILAGYAVTLTR